MTVKVLILKNNYEVISEIEEREDEDADCVLINPKTIVKTYIYDEAKDLPPDNALEFGTEQFSRDTAKVYLTLENFIPYTYQKQIPIRSADIFTIVEPREDLLKYYREVIG
jgi:hypothetical protein